MLTSLTRATLLSAVLVNGTGNVETEILSLQHVNFIESLVLRASSVSGTADVKLEYVTSPDGTNFESYSDTTDITSSTLVDKPNNAEGFNPFFPPIDAPLNSYVKFRVTGIGSNPADTLVTLYAQLREGVR